MLEANPNLTWRDIQYLLVENAFKIDPSDADWTINGAGKNINHNYGFGGVDTRAIVAAATNWNSVPEAVSDSAMVVSVNKAIPDGIDNGVYGTAVTETFNSTADITLEHVELKVNFTHTYRGDLRVRLTSPAGTESVLALQHNDATDNLTNWYYMSVRHWGESSQGNWTIRVDDGFDADVGTWVDYQLIFHGVPASSGCPTSLTLDQVIASGTYEANQNITASGTILSDENVELRAGEYILLQPGFLSELGSECYARIQPCSNPLQETTTIYTKNILKEEVSVTTIPAPTLSVYPNPTSGHGTIEVFLPTETTTSLQIFDALGRELTTIIEKERKEKGFHQIPLQLSESYQKGIYFILLRTFDDHTSKTVSTWQKVSLL